MKKYKRISKQLKQNYKQFKEERQKSFDSISNKYIFYAFSNDQFKQGLEKFNLTETKEDLQKLCSLGCGAYMLKTGKEALKAHNEKFDKLLKNKLKNLDFAINALYYEMSNHEYYYSYDLSETLDSLDISEKDLQNNRFLAYAIRLSKKKYWKACNNYEW